MRNIIPPSIVAWHSLIWKLVKLYVFKIFCVCKWIKRDSQSRCILEYGFFYTCSIKRLLTNRCQWIIEFKASKWPTIIECIWLNLPYSTWKWDCWQFLTFIEGTVFNSCQRFTFYFNLSKLTWMEAVDWQFALWYAQANWCQASIKTTKGLLAKLSNIDCQRTYLRCRWPLCYCKVHECWWPNMIKQRHYVVAIHWAKASKPIKTCYAGQIKSLRCIKSITESKCIWQYWCNRYWKICCS